MIFRDESYSNFLRAMYSSSIIVFILNLFSHIIIARILTPTDFGMLAMILATESIILMAVDLGISTRIIQKKKVDDEVLNKYFYYTIITGSIIGALITLFVLYQNGVSSPWIYCGILLMCDGLLIVPLANTRKELQFKELARGYLLSSAISVVFTLSLIYFWQDIRVVILGMLVSKILLFKYLKPHNKSLQFKSQKGYFGSVVFKDLYEIKYIFGNQFFNILSARIDDLIVGNHFGNIALGLYNISWNLMALPLVRINSVINEVSFPFYVAIKNSKSKFQHYLDNLLFCMLLGLPILLLLVLNADELVLIIYGNKWIDAVPILKILGIVGIAKLINNPGGAYLLSLNKNSELMYWSLGWLIIIILIFGGMSVRGFQLESILNAFLVASFLSVLIFKIIILRLTKYQPKQYLVHLLILFSSLLLYFLLKELNFGITQLFSKVLLKSVLFLIGYGIILYFMNRKFKFLTNE